MLRLAAIVSLGLCATIATAAVAQAFYNEQVAAAALSRAPTIVSGQTVSGHFTAADPGFTGTRWHIYPIQGRAGQVLTVTGRTWDSGRGEIQFHVYQGRVVGGLDGSSREIVTHGKSVGDTIELRAILPQDGFYTIAPIIGVAGEDRGKYAVKVKLGPPPPIVDIKPGEQAQGAIGAGGALGPDLEPATLYRMKLEDGYLDLQAPGAVLALETNLNEEPYWRDDKITDRGIDAGTYYVVVAGEPGRGFTLNSSFTPKAVRDAIEAREEAASRAVSEAREKARIASRRVLGSARLILDFTKNRIGEEFRVPAVKGRRYTIRAVSPDTGIWLYVQSEHFDPMRGQNPKAESGAPHVATDPVVLTFVAPATGDYFIQVSPMSRSTAKSAKIWLEEASD